jgi:thymidylate synthase
MLQELLAAEIGADVGWYQHAAGSLHIYERHLDMARCLAGQAADDDGIMSPMADLSALPRFLDIERRLREGEVDAVRHAGQLPGYWRDLIASAVELHTSRFRTQLAAR